MKSEVSSGPRRHVMRSRLLPIALLLPVALSAALLVGAAPASASETVRTGIDGSCRTTVTEGRVAGQRSGDVCSFRGLRYAAAPVGSLRFRPPQPPPKWTGVLRTQPDANFACPRQPNITESYTGTPPSTTDEDCLRTTVTTPARPGAGRPVMVYLHGGGFLAGSGFQQDFDGTHLAELGNAVIVTINYRLGLFGYLELGGIDPTLAGSGNNGLRDQIAALQWVHRNAAAFGGDPSNITVFGQSAGAISVSALLATNHPEQLFRRAIVESGNGYLVHSPAENQRTANGILSLAGVRTSAELRAMSASDLLKIQDDYVQQHPVERSSLFAPYVDGSLIPADVMTRLAQGSARRVDLLIGTNHDEVMFFVLGLPQLAFLPATANPFFPAQLQDQQAAMIATYDKDLPDGGQLPGRNGTTLAMMNDQLFRVPAIRMAESQSRWNDHTYMYRFDWAPTAPPGTPPADDIGAMHTLELPFVFGTLRLDWVPNALPTTPAEQAARLTLANRMMAAWIAFATTGNPNPPQHPGVPRWRPYDSHARRTMLWNETPQRVNAPADPERAAWDGYPFRSLT